MFCGNYFDLAARTFAQRARAAAAILARADALMVRFCLAGLAAGAVAVAVVESPTIA